MITILHMGAWKISAGMMAGGYGMAFTMYF